MKIHERVLEVIHSYHPHHRDYKDYEFPQNDELEIDIKSEPVDESSNDIDYNHIDNTLEDCSNIYNTIDHIRTDNNDHISTNNSSDVSNMSNISYVENFNHTKKVRRQLFSAQNILTFLDIANKYKDIIENKRCLTAVIQLKVSRTLSIFKNV